MTAFDTIAKNCLALIAAEWQQQGHHLTGDFERALKYTIRQQGPTVEIDLIDGTGRGYGKILELGVRPESIRYPFAMARIEGLQRFVELRGIASGPQARRVAYAIAAAHKRVGMPTPASVRFSRTGRRVGFTEDASVLFKDVIKNELTKNKKAR